jgi:hypothetical protein
LWTLFIQPPGTRRTLVLTAGLLCFAARGSLAVGPFVDVSRFSAYLRSAPAPSLDGAITRASASESQASMFSLAANFPVRSVFLLQLEFPFVTVGFDEGTEDGFGDALLRIKSRLWRGSRKTLSLNTSVRMGSGSVSLFPFASGSTDVEIGLAFVDSVGVGDGANALEPLRSLSYWITAGGNYPLRVNDSIEEAGLYDRCLEAGGGVIAALVRSIEIEAGGLGLVFAEGPVREIYFSRLTYALTDASRISVVVQGERGDENDRAFDASAGIDLTVSY